MKTVDSYRLVAYDTESGKVAFDLPSYAGVHGLSPGIVLRQGEIDWNIIGLRKDSTPEVQRIDVKKVEGGRRADRNGSRREPRQSTLSDTGSDASR